MTDTPGREGEIAVPPDALDRAPSERVIHIGRIRSPWADRAAAPRNLRIARERGMEPARVEIDPPFRDGLAGLAGASHVILLYWLDRARRDLVVQVPRHSDRASGVFALRSPVRPNPIGLAVARLLDVDVAAGLLTIDAIDCFDGTPLLDVKPYLPTVDAFPNATPAAT